MPKGNRPLPLSQQTRHNDQRTILLWGGPYSSIPNTYHMHSREALSSDMMNIAYCKSLRGKIDDCAYDKFYDQNNMELCQSNKTLQFSATARIRPRLRGTPQLQISLPCMPIVQEVRWAVVSVTTTPWSISHLIIPPYSPNADPKGQVSHVWLDTWTYDDVHARCSVR